MKWFSVLAFITGIILVLSCSGWASDETQPAQQTQPKPKLKCKERFDALDANHDGVVTKDEFMAAKHPAGNAEKIFQSRDSDGDGKLTKEEFCSGKGGGGGKGKADNP